MSSPTPFKIPTVPSRCLTSISRLGRYLRQAYNARHSVLQYDRERDMLSVWPWPSVRPIIRFGGQVSPAVLLEHCAEFNIPRPCCFCPLKDATKPAVVEAIFTLADQGIHSGEYVAKCAEGSCGYFVPIQCIYVHGVSDLNTFRAPPGGPSQGPSDPSVVPAPLVHRATPPSMTSLVSPGSNLRPGQCQRLKRSYAVLDLEDVFTIPVIQPHNRYVSETEILLRLDDYAQPGLYEQEFRALLRRMVKCSCGMVMSQRVFKEHRCELGAMRPIKKRRIQRAKEVIDLTSD